MARPSDAIKTAAGSFKVGDGIFIDNGGYAGAGRITELVSAQKPTGYQVFDMIIATPDGDIMRKRVTDMHRGLYKSATLAK